MKNWFIAIVFILLIGFAAFQSIYLSHVTEDLLAVSQQAQAAYYSDQSEKAMDTSQSLLLLWEQYKPALTRLIDHGELDDIQIELLNLLSDMSAGNDQQIPATFARLDYSIAHIGQIDAFGLGNIF